MQRRVVGELWISLGISPSFVDKSLLILRKGLDSIFNRQLRESEWLHLSYMLIEDAKVAPQTGNLSFHW